MSSYEPSYSARGFDRNWLACHSCRKRKTKCDGDLPCSHCIKAEKECIYEERKRPDLSTKALTDKLATLQAKYDKLSAPQYQGETQGSSSTYYSGEKPGYMRPSTRDRDSAQAPFVDNMEISTDVRDSLLEIAFYNLSLTRFELNPDRFMRRLRTQPDHLQPHPSVVSALMLLATFFASPSRPVPRGTPTPEFLLSRTRHCLRACLSDVDRVLDFISASSLLVWWFFQQGRSLEGQYEISTTARLCIDCGLHQLDETVVKSIINGIDLVPPSNSNGRPCLLAPPTDMWDLEARVNVFWHVFLVEKTASLMTGLPSSFDDFSTTNQITTIWPRPLGSYMGLWREPDFASVDNLLGLSRHPGASSALEQPQSVLSAEVQAMVLLTRAIRFSSTPPRTACEAQRLQASIMSLHAALSRFSSSLPLSHAHPRYLQGHHEQLHQLYAFGTWSHSAGIFATALIKTYLQVAAIYLNQATELVSAGSQGRTSSEGVAYCEKRIAAAKSIASVAAEIIREMNSLRPSSRSASPEYPKEGMSVMFGFLWDVAANTLVEYSHQAGNQLQHQRFPASHQAPLISAIDATRQELAIIYDVTRRLAATFPVLGPQVKKIEGMMHRT